MVKIDELETFVPDWGRLSMTVIADLNQK